MITLRIPVLMLLTFSLFALAVPRAFGAPTCETIFQSSSDPTLVDVEATALAKLHANQIVKSSAHDAETFANAVHSLLTDPRPLRPLVYYELLFARLFETAQTLQLSWSQERKIILALKYLRKLDAPSGRNEDSSFHLYSKRLWSSPSTRGDAQQRLRALLKEMPLRYTDNVSTMKAAHKIARFIKAEATTQILYARLVIIVLSEQTFRVNPVFFEAIFRSPHFQGAFDNNELLRYWVRRVMASARSEDPISLQNVRSAISKLSSSDMATSETAKKSGRALAKVIIKEAVHDREIFAQLVKTALSEITLPFSDPFYEALLEDLFAAATDFSLTVAQERTVQDGLAAVRRRDLQDGRSTDFSVNRYMLALWNTSLDSAREEAELRRVLRTQDPKLIGQNARALGIQISELIDYRSHRAGVDATFARMMFISLTENSFENPADFYAGLFTANFQERFDRLAGYQQRFLSEGIRLASKRVEPFVRVPPLMASHLSRERLPNAALQVRRSLTYLGTQLMFAPPRPDVQSSERLDRLATDLAKLISKRSTDEPNTFSQLVYIALVEGFITFPGHLAQAFVRELRQAGKTMTFSDQDAALLIEAFELIPSVKRPAWVQAPTSSELFKQYLADLNLENRDIKDASAIGRATADYIRLHAKQADGLLNKPFYTQLYVIGLTEKSDAPRKVTEAFRMGLLDRFFRRTFEKLGTEDQARLKSAFYAGGLQRRPR